MCSTSVGIERRGGERFTCSEFLCEVWEKSGRITHRFAWASGWYTFQRSGICGLGHWGQWYQGQLCAHSRMSSRYKGKTIGNLLRPSKDTLLCMSRSSWTSDECARFRSKVLQKGLSTSVQLWGWCHCWRCQRCSIQVLKNQGYRDLCNSSVAVILREVQREVDGRRPFEDRLCIDYYISNHFVHTSTASDLDCCFMAILSRWKPPGPRMMRTLWSNSREQMEKYEKRKDAGISYPEGLEILLKETPKRNRPTSETADSPENAPQDHDIRQSGRVLGLQNRDFWIRPNRFVLAFSHTCDCPSSAFQELSWKVISKIKSQRKQDWGSQEMANIVLVLAVILLWAMRSSSQIRTSASRTTKNNVCLWPSTPFRHFWHVSYEKHVHVRLS